MEFPATLNDQEKMISLPFSRQERYTIDSCLPSKTSCYLEFTLMWGAFRLILIFDLHLILHFFACFEAFKASLDFDCCLFYFRIMEIYVHLIIIWLCFGIRNRNWLFCWLFSLCRCQVLQTEKSNWITWSQASCLSFLSLQCKHFRTNVYSLQSR